MGGLFSGGGPHIGEILGASKKAPFYKHPYGGPLKKGRKSTGFSHL